MQYSSGFGGSFIYWAAVKPAALTDGIPRCRTKECDELWDRSFAIELAKFSKFANSDLLIIGHFRTRLGVERVYAHTQATLPRISVILLYTILSAENV